jgi:enoyl-CoA hydratase
VGGLEPPTPASQTRCASDCATPRRGQYTARPEDGQELGRLEREETCILDAPIDLNLDGLIARITLRRPQVRNALDWSTMQAFASCVDRIAGTERLRGLIVTGEGKAFCAGGDLAALKAFTTRRDAGRLADVMGRALRRLEYLPFPTIAAIEGPALGGGAEIALACDLRVMADDAVLGMQHIHLAVVPAWGGGQRLVRLVGMARAVDWLATGRTISAREAEGAGLANRVTPSGSALAEAMALAEVFAGLDASALQAVKRIVLAGATLPPDTAMRRERSEFTRLWLAPAHWKAAHDRLARVAGRSKTEDSARSSRPTGSGGEEGDPP